MSLNPSCNSAAGPLTQSQLLMVVILEGVIVCK